MFGYRSLGFGAFPNRETTYTIANSALFNDDDSDFLSKTFETAGNRRLWTWSAWIKFSGASTARQMLFGGGGAHDGYLSFNENAQPDHILNFYNGPNGDLWTWRPDRLFRDPTAWYHVVWVFDSNNGTVAQRMRIYVNGVEETAITKSSSGSQNVEGPINEAALHKIGLHPANSNNPFDGYMAEIVFLDGVAAAPTSFGKFNSSGVWVPIDPLKQGLNFGTTGFFLGNRTTVSSNMTTFVDSGPTGHTITTAGNATHSPLSHKVENSVIYLDGSGDHIKFAQSGHTDFTFGTGDWCIEGWFHRIALSGTSNISYIVDFRYASNDDDRPAIYMDGSNNIIYYANDGARITSSTDPSLATWFHLAVAKSSGTTTMYLNGTSVGTYSDSIDYLVGRPYFFDYPQSNAYGFNGYATELRISKGAARHTSNFTPSTSAFASDSNTSLLIHSNKNFGVANDDSGTGNNWVNN